MAGDDNKGAYGRTSHVLQVDERKPEGGGGLLGCRHGNNRIELRKLAHASYTSYSLILGTWDGAYWPSVSPLPTSAVMAGAPVSRRYYIIGYSVNIRPIRALKLTTIIAGDVPTRLACLE